MEKTATGPEPNKFPHDIQRRILAVLLYDQEFSLEEAQNIIPEYFEILQDQDIARIVLRFWQEQGRRPEADELLHLIHRDIATSKRIKPPEVYYEAYEEATELARGDLSFVRDQLRPWIRHEHLRVELMKQIHLWDKGDDEAVLNSMKKVMDGSLEKEGQAAPNLDLERIGSIQEEPIEWLWKNVVPFGMLTIVSGDPSVGKSFFAIELASRLSTGRPFPGCTTGVTGNTIYMIKELPKKQVLKPRFVAAGADMDRIERLTGHYVKQKEFMVFDTNKNMELLVRHVAAHPEVRLVVIDPIISFVTETADLNAPGRARHAMDRLAEFAEKTGLAVVVIMHLNKDQTQKLISRTSGSHQLLAASMFGWVVAKDPEDKERRLVMPSKNNAGPMDDDEAWVFRIHGFEYTTAEGVLIETGKAEFEDETAHGVDAAGIVSPEAIVGTSMTAEAKRWLIIELQNGPVLARELYDRGELAGFSAAVLASAKRQLGIRHDKEGYQGASRWFLPDKYLPKERDLTE